MSQRTMLSGGRMMKHAGRYSQNHALSLARSILIVACFVVIGFFAVHITHAATYATSAEAESGHITGNAKNVSSRSASGGLATLFGVHKATPPPSNGGGNPSGGSGGSGSSAPPPSNNSHTAAARYHWGKPTWSKEFNGNHLDSDWAVYNSPGNGGNGLRRPSQITVGNGLMTIAGTRNGTSGGMALGDHFEKYGRWEVRFRAFQTGSSGNGYHPIFAIIPGGGTPYHCGATDIDYPEYTFGEGSGYIFIHNLPSYQDYKTYPVDYGWHTYALEVTPSHLTAFIDGKPIMTDNNASHIPSEPKALNFQLDQYYGGGYNPAKEQADWVRYYPLNTGRQVTSGSAPQIGGYNGAC